MRLFSHANYLLKRESQRGTRNIGLSLNLLNDAQVHGVEQVDGFE
jgi:hypothetical protein